MSDYWKDNNIKKPQQIVVCAACKQGETIICGARHFDRVMHTQIDKMDVRWASAEQGFIDQFGLFLTREDAMQIVKDNGQPFNLERNGGSDIELYSEGLY